jgi:hypothetical protein
VAGPTFEDPEQRAEATWKRMVRREGSCRKLLDFAAELRKVADSDVPELGRSALASWNSTAVRHGAGRSAAPCRPVRGVRGTVDREGELRRVRTG